MAARKNGVKPTGGDRVATSVELAKLIRFCLAGLAGENGHHEFEHVCRHVARLRIASNVLPATGPVSAGGDQGRDFETFRTYLIHELPFAIGFLARASSETIAFACTIQRSGLRSKFEQDMTAICSQGTPVDHVVIFAAADVATRLRHDLQDWASDAHGVTLDVFDGAALSELLADSSLYWIAEEFLHVPAELAPTGVESLVDELPDWYIAIRGYWQTAQRRPVTFGDLFELQRGLRHAMWPGPSRVDLDGWLALMQQLCAEAPSKDVRLRAVYEMTMAYSRAKAELRPVEQHVRRYMAEIQEVTDPTILFDASIVIQAMGIGSMNGHTDIPLRETTDWIAPLRAHVDRLLEADHGPNEMAGLLQAAAHLGMHMDWSDIDVSAAMSLVVCL